MNCQILQDSIKCTLSLSRHRSQHFAAALDEHLGYQSVEPVMQYVLVDTDNLNQRVHENAKHL